MNLYIRRGTTTPIKIKTSFPFEEIKDAWISVKQGKAEIIKTLKDCTKDGDGITTILTEKETLLFKAYDKASVQARIVLQNGSVDASEIYIADIKEIQKEG